MAPGLVDPQSSSGNEQPSSDMPTLYMLDTLHPEAVKHAQQLFKVVLPTDPEIQHWRENARYLAVRSSYITAADIQACKQLRAIGKQGVGLDKVDVDACREAGIEVFNTPGVNSKAVAELVLALTMSVAREIGSIRVRQNQGEVVPKETCSGLLLSGKTLGLIGMGNISRCVADIFRGAFNASIVAYDPFAPADAWKDFEHIRAKSVTQVLEPADVVSVHVPLTKDTRDLIALNEMKMMKSTAILINAARGGIVNEDDLATALETGTIWGAGVDCHEEEPPTKARYERLWSNPRMISTPHIGAATSQTQVETAIAAVDSVYQYIRGRKRQ
ncbi:hypothetical protein M409DRAFT_26775 [Zasmidium cellare ATCC 36951]|uniref:D-3-phosphoglycerate dehydrogenase n=1 Tax=Zasmidium cellare ATCC 36951 TaxID=1080233 RepID=A0A6A6CAJ7_ZASCE|nr:uncharacterized protein M409DRAFT_26775 [Zasmidium cellare ATCC 36951]KAF2162922.1 hypothetical protein M409DRAFT_26775 [Zasmidium cellare ATCC 36951]